MEQFINSYFWMSLFGVLTSIFILSIHYFSKIYRTYIYINSDREYDRCVIIFDKYVKNKKKSNVMKEHFNNFNDTITINWEITRLFSKNIEIALRPKFIQYVKSEIIRIERDQKLKQIGI